MSEKIRLPAYNLTRVLQLKALIHDDPEVLSFIGPPMSAEEFSNFVRHVAKKIRPKVGLPVLTRSLRSLQGEPLTQPAIRQMAWRLAGNMQQLRLGKPVPQWTRQTSSEWMPLQVIDAIPKRTKYDKIGTTYTFRIMAGSACGLLTQRFWTTKFCRFLSQTLGFTAPWGKYPFKHPNDFIGMRLFGLFTFETCNKQPHFQEFRVAGSMVEHNRQLLQFRARHGFACPKGYKHACRLCPVGYDVCPVATHARTYVKQYCENCERQIWFDLGRRKDICVTCQQKLLLTKKE